MSTSDRFKPIQKVASHKERKAAVDLGESLRNRDNAQLRLDELRRYHAEYLQNFSVDARRGLSPSRILEYQAFIDKLEQAIAEQEKVLAQLLAAYATQQAAWRGRYTKAKAMDNAVDRMHQREQQERDKKEQAVCDDRSPRRRDE